MSKVVTFIISFALLAIIIGTTNNAKAKNLVFCSEASPEGFDTALYTAGSTFDASSRQLYNKLVEFEYGGTNVVPGLATSWQVSDDGLVYTFNLRRGVKFHSTDYFTPTRDFNADDVVFSLERQRLEDNPYYSYVVNAAWEYFSGMDMPALIESVEKINDYTVRITLTKPEAPMIANLAMDFASIVSKEYADNLLAAGQKEQLNTMPIGTGPFKFVNYTRDSAIRYVAHDDYWAGRAKIDNLIFAITTDASVRFQRLKAGECHVMAFPNAPDIARMKTERGITVLEQEGLNIDYLAYNTLVAPFDNPRVRQALNMAINKEVIAQAVYQGEALVAKNLIPPTIWSYNDDIAADVYDPVQAKSILEAEGVSNLDMKIWAAPAHRIRVAELMQDDLKKVGVNVEIVTYEWGEYLSRSRELDRDGAVIIGWNGDNGDPDNFFYILLGCEAVGGSNRANWCYKPFDDLLKEAKLTSDVAKRTEYYRKAQEIQKEQAPMNNLTHRIVFKVIRDEVKNFKIDPFGGNAFYEVDIIN